MMLLGAGLSLTALWLGQNWLRGINDSSVRYDDERSSEEWCVIARRGGVKARLTAVTKLGHSMSFSKPTWETLVKCLETDSDPRVRAEAVMALGFIVGQSAPKEIMDKTLEVYDAALSHALGHIQEPGQYKIAMSVVESLGHRSRQGEQSASLLLKALKAPVGRLPATAALNMKTYHQQAPSLIPALFKALKNPRREDFGLEINVGICLRDFAKHNPKGCQAALSEALQSPEPAIRRAALGALQENDSERYEEVRLMIRQDADPWVRIEAMEALWRLSLDKQKAGTRAELFRAFEEIDESVRAEALKELREPGPERDLSARFTACKALELLAKLGLQDKRSVALLTQALKHPSHELRGQAKHSWLAIEDSATPRLVALLGQKNPMLREQAAELIQAKARRLKDATQLLPMFRGLMAAERDPVFKVRRAVSRALATVRLEATRARERLQPLQSAKDQAVPALELIALVESKNPKELELLLARLSAEDPKQQQAAARALGLVAKIPEGGQAELRGLVSHADAGVRRAAAEALGRIGSRGDVKQAQSLLVSLLEDAEPRVVEAALYGLSDLGPQRGSAKALQGFMTHKQAKLRMAAGFALSVQTDIPAELRGLVWERWQRSQPGQRLELLLALGAFVQNTERVMPVLKECVLKSADLNEAMCALCELFRFHKIDPGVLDFVEGLKRDARVELRQVGFGVLVREQGIHRPGG